MLRLLLLLTEARGDEPGELLRQMRSFGYGLPSRAVVGAAVRSEYLRLLLKAAAPRARKAWWWAARRATAAALR